MKNIPGATVKSDRSMNEREWNETKTNEQPKSMVMADRGEIHAKLDTVHGGAND